MSLNAEYWNERYEAENSPWDMGTPSPALIEYLGSQEDKSIRILIPGAGKAHDASWAFEQGFQSVYVVDWAEEALDRMMETYPGFPVSHLICDDFFQHQGQYDLILEQTFFCALDPTLRTAYAEKMKELLVKGGKLVGVWFDFLKEDGPPFGGTLAEYESYFQEGWRIDTFERCRNSIPPRAGQELFGILERV